MGHSRKVRLGALLVLGVTAAAMLVTAATAGPPFGETIHEEGEFVVEDFCDEEGLDVGIAFVSDVRVQVQPRGNAGLLYFMQHGKLTETITNLANDKFVTTATTVLDKELRVSDNGDGTLTILILATAMRGSTERTARPLPGTRDRFASRSSSTTAARRPIRRTTQGSRSSW